MPKITFNEVDLTSPGTLNVAANTVYVPGFSVSGPVNEPILVNSIAELERIFGEESVTFSATVTTADGNKVFAQGEAEPSYLYAKTLLSAGLPVMFERCTDIVESTHQIEGPVAYQALAETLETKSPIKDCGSYNVKFLTSGGYPNIEGITQTSTESGSLTPILDSRPVINNSSLDKDIDLTKLSSSSDLESAETVAKRLKDANLGYSNIYYSNPISGLSTTPFGIYVDANQSIADLKDVSFAITSNAKYLRKLGNSLNQIHSWIIDGCWLELKATRPSVKDSWIVQLLAVPYTDTFGEHISYIDTTIETAQKDNLLYTGTDTANTQYPDAEKPELLYQQSCLAEHLFDLLQDFYFATDSDNMILYSTTAVSKSTGFESITSSSILKIGNALKDIATARKDCVALLDHTPNIKPENLKEQLKNVLPDSEYCAMFTPWGTYTVAGDMYNHNMPASFAYLLALANSTVNNPDWLAVAGANRGSVPRLQSLNENVTNALAESYQPRQGQAINPITEIRPYGNIIWGNRTLKKNPTNLTAKSFLNIRVLICNVVKTAFAAARSMTFEQNNDILWVNFKSMIIPTLDQMVKGAGISAYELKKRANKQKAELRCVIRLYAIEAVEDFEIELQLADNTSAVIE